MAYDEGGDEIRRVGRLKGRGAVWKKRGDRLHADKANFHTLWQAQAEIFYPERADFTAEQSSGVERYEGIYTSVPQRMRRDMANNLGAMLRPRGKEWFKASVRPVTLAKGHAAKRWLETATSTQRNIVYASGANFTRAFAESDQDYVCFGNSVIRHSYNREGDGLLFQCSHMKDNAWAVNAEGVVDENHEKMQMDLRQVRQLFGVEAMPKDWLKMLDQEPHRKVVVQRCVAPIDDDQYEKGERPRADARFMSLYMACGVKEEEAGLGEGFFNWFPYLIRRWMTVSGEPYGRSPCTGVALSDARTLNVAQQALLKSIEWKVDPPKVAAHDAIIGEIDRKSVV